MDEIEQVMAMVDAAVGSANSYSESLANVDRKLGQSKDREGLRAIVESLVQTAQEMKQNNQKLEARLIGLQAGDQPAAGEPRNGAQREPDRSADRRCANRKYFDDALEQRHRRSRDRPASRCRC